MLTKTGFPGHSDRCDRLDIAPQHSASASLGQDGRGPQAKSPGLPPGRTSALALLTWNCVGSVPSLTQLNQHQIVEV
jgi:hypothetical protein